MPMYRLDEANGSLIEVSPTWLSEEGIRESDHLQRWLSDTPGALEPDLFVLSEEYSDWEGSSRRIDLLALDRDGRLVVIELKRDEDAFMDLQAVRYAALVANMTFDQAVDAHRRYLEGRGIEEDARERVIAHLGVEEGAEPEIDSGRPRILLAARDFPQELTTSVLWLNDSGLDIRCIRLLPYRVGGELVLDVTVLLPLPEAQRYMVRIREREAEQAASTHRELDWTRDDIGRLAGLVTNGFVLMLLDACAEVPGQWVELSAIRKRGSPEQQARWPKSRFGIGAMGGLTRLIRRTFGRDNWPVDYDYRQGLDSRAFRMSDDIARWWGDARAGTAPGGRARDEG